MPKIKNKHKVDPATFALTVALPSVGRVAIVTGHAALAVRPCCQVPTVLAHGAVHAPAVTITLTRWEETHRVKMHSVYRIHLQEVELIITIHIVIDY